MTARPPSPGERCPECSNELAYEEQPDDSWSPFCIVCGLGLPDEDEQPASSRPAPATDQDKIQKALDIAACYSQIDGAHHKAWVIDQMVRALLADGYDAWVEACKAGEDGPHTYDWDEGCAP